MTYMSSIPRMDPAVKANWVAELRSGKREQGTQRLSRDGKFCCLGVLCDISPVESHPHVSGSIGDSGTLLWKGNSSTLPFEVINWAWNNDGYRLVRDNPTVFTADWPRTDRVNNHLRQWTLAELNDGGLTFDQIADVIDYFL